MIRSPFGYLFLVSSQKTFSLKTLPTHIYKYKNIGLYVYKHMYVDIYKHLYLHTTYFLSRLSPHSLFFYSSLGTQVHLTCVIIWLMCRPRLTWSSRTFQWHGRHRDRQTHSHMFPTQAPGGWPSCDVGGRRERSLFM